ncbi:MAG: DUF6279 family lipoprotein [Syntrophales bacterium]
MKKFGFVALLSMVTLMEACSQPKLAWNNAEFLVMYQLDHYFDLSRDEGKAWRPRIAALVARFQGEAGPELVLFLRKSRDTLLAGLTEEKVASLFHEWDVLRVRHLSPLTADATEYLAGLDDANAAYLRKRFLNSQKKDEKVLALDDEEYAKNRASKARERVERFYGRISTAQAKKVGSLPGLTRQAQRDHIAQMQESQKSLLDILGRALPRDQIKNRLDQWVQNPATMRTTERGRLLYTEERRTLIKNIVAIDRLMSPDQRNHFAEKLDGWRTDLMDSLKEVKR